MNHDARQDDGDRQRHALEISGEALAGLLDDAARLAAGYWSGLEARPAYPETSATETARLFARPWADEGRGAAVLEDFTAIAAHSRPSGGRFFGYVFGSGEPVGALGDLLASVLNQNVGAWRSAPAAVAVEQAVIGWLADAIGCPGFTGSLCGGGSSANLMALAMAREAKLPANEDGARPGIVYASEQVHMSVPKAVALIGLGRRNLRLIPVDAEKRMRLDALEAAIAQDRAAGRTPLAIVATAGTVATGAIDPLPAIAAIARREDLWMHVDGAFGVLAALAAPALFEGLSQADSLSLDAHKWLYQPVDCGCLLHRHGDVARETFSHSGDYVRALNTDPGEAFAYFEESLELSRRFRALKLWMSLQYHGRAAFRAAIARDLAHARLLERAVAARPELELLSTGPLSAVCFRHREKDNEALLRRVIARRRVFLSNATLDARFALRACFVNHRTTEEDVRLIVEEVIAAAGEIDG
ncbi:pyridoxal phosphate-dependent decarboxylase family protein [Ancylobacter oerskovii]|uniref:Pyridoxal phosphate-dependent decarboxylase family protein n=1 Tax=Ancylobacter oerskovii TaxID=459519 RepID=A0ABW4Z480_9HYPH|nr:aminotransferase class V-fold PLP-dependent enzyme [Ancylobacter oerskovii]MBS7545755.1 aminotransferase class V-fold PLP-dependent enzyme [Ancylobacter oerskovii]